MKKVLVISVSALLLLSSCGTYAGSGAATGGWFGSVIGSAIGGISGGHRGSDIGTLIGMAGGAVVGAAVGSAADQKRQQAYSGDDRLYGMGEDFGSVVTVDADALSALEIRNVAFVDAGRDGVLTRGEEARVVFEIYNYSSKLIRSVRPMVAEVTGNKHIRISESILIEGIAPGKGVRYTASVKADRSLKNGEAVIRIGVMQGNREIPSQTQEIAIRTAKQ